MMIIMSMMMALSWRVRTSPDLCTRDGMLVSPFGTVLDAPKHSARCKYAFTTTCIRQTGRQTDMVTEYGGEGSTIDNTMRMIMVRIVVIGIMMVGIRMIASSWCGLLSIHL